VIELSAGVLSRIAPNSTARQYLDNDVSCFAVDGGGAVIELSAGVLSRIAPIRRPAVPRQRRELLRR